MRPELSPAPNFHSGRHRWPRRLVLALVAIVLFGVTLWAVGALYYDLPWPAARPIAANVYGLLMLAVGVGLRRGRVAVIASGFLVVLGWWLSIAPSNDRDWQPDVAQTAWTEVDREKVTLHNVRNSDYRSETDYTPRWETRTVDLTKLCGVDLAINYWGSAWMAHPIASFQFEDAPPVCFSIETRKEVGESYSAIGGLYRQYELICICADERDVIRARTNFRHGEDVYLYRTNVAPDRARERFLEYVATMDALRRQPRWYNAATTNCTTTIRTQHDSAHRAPWDWRILFNGYADQMLYEHGAFAGGLPFAELKAQARINDAAQAAGDAPDFSHRIRAGRPGFALREK